jgi:hypothetical protein
MKTHSLLALFGLSSVAVSLGCSPEFDPYLRLQDLRVMAIQSNPVAPVPGESTTLTPLVYVPNGMPEPTYAWSWCPLVGTASDGYPCQFTEAQLAQQLQAAGGDPSVLPPYNLGTQPTAVFPHTIPPAWFTPFCTPTTPGGRSLVNCDLGFPVQIRLVVRLPDGSATIDSVRTLNLRLESETAPNLNPVVSGISATEVLPRPPGSDPKADAPTRVVDMTDGTAVTLRRQRNNKIRVAVFADQSQPYIDKDARGMPLPSGERLYISWFIETGDARHQTTSYIPGESSIERFLENEWRPESPQDYAPNTSRVYAIVRDNRGGVSWRVATVNLRVVPEDEE